MGIGLIGHGGAHAVELAMVEFVRAGAAAPILHHLMAVPVVAELVHKLSFATETAAK